jgi:hypothetical protein
MTEKNSHSHVIVLQDRKRLPGRFHAAFSGRATAHLA